MSCLHHHLVRRVVCQSPLQKRKLLPHPKNKKRRMCQVLVKPLMTVTPLRNLAKKKSRWLEESVKKPKVKDRGERRKLQRLKENIKENCQIMILKTIPQLNFIARIHQRQYLPRPRALYDLRNPVIQPAVGESEADKLMKLPSISTGKWVTMGADDFKSLMDFVRYVRKNTLK